MCAFGKAIMRFVPARPSHQSRRLLFKQSSPGCGLIVGLTTALSHPFETDHRPLLRVPYASILQAIDGAVPVASCPQAASRAPQHFRPAETHATCGGCSGCQSNQLDHTQGSRPTHVDVRRRIITSRILTDASLEYQFRFSLPSLNEPRNQFEISHELTCRVSCQQSLFLHTAQWNCK